MSNVDQKIENVANKIESAVNKAWMQKSDAERHLHGVLATSCRRASDTSPP